MDVGDWGGGDKRIDMSIQSRPVDRGGVEGLRGQEVAWVGENVTRQLGGSPMGSSSEQVDTLALKHINHIVAFQQWSQIADMVGPTVRFFFCSV